MPSKKSISLSASRGQLVRQIAEAADAVSTGVEAVKRAKQAGKNAIAARNAKTLGKARQLLRKLRRHERSIADECCSKVTQNCDFLFY